MVINNINANKVSLKESTEKSGSSIRAGLSVIFSFAHRTDAIKKGISIGNFQITHIEMKNQYFQKELRCDEKISLAVT